MAFWRQHLHPTLSIIVLIIFILLTFFLGFKIGQELYKISTEFFPYNHIITTIDKDK
ncbi:MAG: hypothetical protein N2259_00985 [Patescibacteria group bacterium]|nr:hypothetical protein [Patescibacteria group bacterium]